ncbi:MAG: hypothetical protein HZA54_01435, partial [Planctomycetes bacterium]|nr:hypothetical protein [Planctomycetota bacterium]
ESAGGITAILAQANCPAGGNQVIDYQFRPDGTCTRIAAADRTFVVVAGANYDTYKGSEADVIVMQEDGGARLLIDVNPMGGKIQKMIFQVAAAAAPRFQ